MKITFSRPTIEMLEELIDKPKFGKDSVADIRDADFDKIKDFHRDVVLEQGRTNFDEFSNGVEGKQKVEWYCFYYLQMHLTHNICCYFADVDWLVKVLAQGKRIVFIDFGCGPLTSAIALKKVCDIKHLSLSFDYIGIDSSVNMLAKAKQFQVYPKLFDENHKFHFLNSYQGFDEVVADIVKEHADEFSFVFNFSYFFASRSVVVKEVFDITKKLIDTYPASTFCALHQNPALPQLNNKWGYYKQLLKNYLLQKEGYPVIRPYTYTDNLGSSKSKYPSLDLKVYCDVLVKM